MPHVHLEVREEVDIFAGTKRHKCADATHERGVNECFRPPRHKRSLVNRSHHLSDVVVDKSPHLMRINNTVSKQAHKRSVARDARRVKQANRTDLVSSAVEKAAVPLDS